MEGYGRNDGGFRPQNNGGGFGRPQFSPVNVGDEIEVNIEAVGEKGDGICKVKGFVLFVPNTREGQNVKVRVTRVLRKVGFAEVIGEGSPAAEGSEEEPTAEEELVPEGEVSEDFGEESTEEAGVCCGGHDEPCEDSEPAAEETPADDLQETPEEEAEEDEMDAPPAPEAEAAEEPSEEEPSEDKEKSEE